VRGIWRAVGPSTRTDLLARRFDEWWFDGVELEQVDRGVRWIINAANLTTGVRFGFERDTVGDYTIGHVSTAGTGLRLSTAVAASAAVPGAFAPVVLRSPEFPGADHAPVLMDGGRVTAPNLAFWTPEEGFGVENVGVPPDVEVEQLPAEVLAGKDPQLEKAIAIVLEELRNKPAPKPQRPPFPQRAKNGANGR